MNKISKSLPEKKVFHVKLKIMMALLFILYCVVALKTVQIIEDEKYMSYKKYRKYYLVKKNIDIKTREGKLLTKNTETKDMFLNPKYIEKSKINLFFNLIENKLNRKISQIEKIRIKREIYSKNRVKVLEDLRSEEIKKIKNTYRIMKRIKFLKYFYSNNGKKYLYGPEFEDSNINKRRYSKDSKIFEPFLGFKNEKTNMHFGIEAYIDKQNTQTRLEIYNKSKRGVILNTTELLRNKIDKLDNITYNLTLEYGLQKRIDRVIKEENERIGAKNILISVVKVKTGEIISLNQYLNFDPNNIKKEDNKKMKDYYTNYSYEVGSVMKPITLSILLETGAVSSLEEKIKTDNGVMYIGRKKITDEHPEEEMSIKEIISHSSNVGIARLSLRLNNNEYYKGLYKYKVFNKKNKLETVFNQQYYFPNRLKKALEKNKMIQRATTSYGYGYRITPYILQRIYNMFANDGMYLDFNIIRKRIKKSSKLMTKGTANKIKKTLRAVVLEGTGKAANLNNFKVYGKTGTSHIVSSGKYEKKYNSTFVGFVEGGNGEKYNILVLVVEPKYKYHFASLSAVPIFKKVVKELFYLNKIKMIAIKNSLVSKNNKIDYNKEKKGS